MAAIVISEYLFLYYGRMFHDYSSVVSGYGRAVEIHLKRTLLPKLKEWVESYGELDHSNNKRYLILASGTANPGKLFADKLTDQMMLGQWCNLFTSRYLQKRQI